MSDQPQPDENVAEGAEEVEGRPPSPTEAAVVDPQKLIRIASVTREVLEEARRIRPEPGAVDHLKRLYGTIHEEMKESLPPELFREFDELTPDIKEGSLEELALGQAEILGWLEGLFQGTQIAMQLQAMRAFSDAQRHQLAPGAQPEQAPPGDGRDPRYL